MNDVISVIVPVYNVAQYLPQAVESILSQDYEKLEVILIDDGSKDDSGRICDCYAARDARVKVIHQKNGGAAAAKNAGLRIATGEYLSFVDSDDYLESNVYTYMVNLLKQEQADLVQFAFRNVYKNHTEDFILHPGRSRVDTVSYLKRFPSDWTCALLWNKLYRRELFDGIFFEEGHRIDDEFFTYQGVMNAKKIVVDDRIIYNYRRRASSAMNSAKAGQQLQFDRVDYMDKRRRKIAARFPELKWDFDFGFVDALIYLSQNSDNNAATIQLLKSKLREYIWHFGNTCPPRYLWKDLLRLYFTKTETLLSQCPQRTDAVNLDDYFA